MSEDPPENTPEEDPSMPERRDPSRSSQKNNQGRRMSDSASLFNIPQNAVVDRRNDAQFQHDIKRLIEKAEARRVEYMNQHQTHRMLGMSVSLLLQIGGAAGFGWFFLMHPDLIKAISCLLLGLILPFFLHGWVEKPIHDYVKNYKREYLPALAELIGGFSYHAQRGLGEGLLKKTGVVPPYATYKSEDCFRGRYKGTKVLFSEATLLNKKKNSVFNGLMILVELPSSVFEGHTIVTADRDMAAKYEKTRWHKLSPVMIDMPQKEWDRFVVYSTRPESAQLVLGQKIIKELAEADMAFNDAQLSAVFFRGKYIFLMIPHEEDMFEASDLYVPVSSAQHSIACKKEIDKILEVIDIFDLYGRA